MIDFLFSTALERRLQEYVGVRAKWAEKTHKSAAHDHNARLGQILATVFALSFGGRVPVLHLPLPALAVLEDGLLRMLEVVLQRGRAQGGGR